MLLEYWPARNSISLTPDFTKLHTVASTAYFLLIKWDFLYTAFNVMDAT